jgi:hypothetical protein
MPLRLYAVLRLRGRVRPKLPRGLRGERLKIVKYAGCAVAVADTRAVLDPELDNLLEFDRVICELAALSEAILPARFGTVSASSESLRSEIAERAGALEAALDNVTGRVQMTARLPAAPKAAKGSGRGSSYLEKRAAMSRSPALTKLRKVLGSVVREERVEAGPAGTRVYHLIDRRDVEDYLSRLKELRASGPFPPYAFAPGIDHAFWRGYDDQKSESPDARSPRSRTHRRSARNAG